MLNYNHKTHALGYVFKLVDWQICFVIII